MSKYIKPNCKLCKYREKKKCLWFGDEFGDDIGETIVCEAYEKRQAKSKERK